MISLVIPCHNEQAVLPELIARVYQSATDWNDDWEVILVDDGSHDTTWELIQGAHGEDPRWKGIRLARNFGHQAAIGAGLEQARGDAVVVLDADLQDPPELIAQMLGKWEEGYAVVYGVRETRPEGRLKRFCYWAFYRLAAWSCSISLPRDAGDFCLMDARVVRALRRFREQRPFWRGLRAWTGFRQIGLPYEREQRYAGKSKYSFRQLGRLALDGFFSLCPAPARALAWLGLISFVATALAAIAFRGIPLTAETRFLRETGFLIGGLFLGSVQLLISALVVAYLGRTYNEVRQRPRWVIADTLGLAKVKRKKSRRKTDYSVQAIPRS